MTCDDYQIAFDQQRASVISPIPAAELDAHVAACAACTAYVSLSEKVSKSMMTTLTLSPAPPDPAAILARIADLRRRMRRSVTLLPVAIGLVMFGYFVMQGGFTAHEVIGSVVGVAVGGVACFGALALMLRRRLASLEALETRSGDALVIGLRAEIDAGIRGERQSWWLLPLLLVAFHLTLVGLAWPSLPYLVFEILYLGIPLPLGIRRYRRLVRERALLA